MSLGYTIFLKNKWSTLSLCFQTVYDPTTERKRYAWLCTKSIIIEKPRNVV